MKKFIKNIFVLALMFMAFTAIMLGCVPINGVSDSANFATEQNGTDKNADQNQDSGETVENQTPEVVTVAYIKSLLNGLNVRTSPSVASKSLGTLDKGDMVSYISEINGWYVTFFRNQIAYVAAGGIYTELYETLPSENEAVENVISVGVKLLGTPYVYGAVRLHDGYGHLLKNFSVNAFDCSSLMQYMFYYGAGENLMTTTRTQVYQGTNVQRADLKRGDLMFFTNSTRYYNTGIERIGHVAIYLGDNYILHTASDHAVIEKISSLRWSYFIEGRRILN